MLTTTIPWINLLFFSSKKSTGNSIYFLIFFLKKTSPLIEAILLAQTAQNVLCFSRTFEDLTCFWDEPAHVKGAYRFFYTYEG